MTSGAIHYRESAAPLVVNGAAGAVFSGNNDVWDRKERRNETASHSFYPSLTSNGSGTEKNFQNLGSVWFGVSFWAVPEAPKDRKDVLLT